MAEKPVVAVFGATGAQGGAVVDALLADGSFEVRGISRDRSSDKSNALAAKGVKVVQADQHDLNSVKEALKGAYGVFLVTIFWDPQSTGKELEVGSKIVGAAKEVGVTHFIWSTLPNVEKESGGTLKVPHFTDKAKVNEVVAGTGFEYYTFVEAAAYYSNFQYFNPPKVDEDGTVVFRLPLAPEKGFAQYDTADTGLGVVAALKYPEKYGSGQYISYNGTTEPMSKIVEQFSEVTGRKARYEQVSWDVYKANAGEEITEMFRWFDEYGYYGSRDSSTGEEAAGKKLTSWVDWLKKTGWKGPE